jgi:hypothetical protein
MRHTYSSVTPLVIRQYARKALACHFDWRPFGKLVTVDALLDLLLLVAASAGSLFATVRRFFVSATRPRPGP